MLVFCRLSYVMNSEFQFLKLKIGEFLTLTQFFEIKKQKKQLKRLPDGRGFESQTGKKH